MRRWSWLVAVLLLAPAPALRGEPSDAPGWPMQSSAVSAALPAAPGALLERLPPAARHPGQHPLAVPEPAPADAGRPGRVVERIGNLRSDAMGPAWFEVEYTVDPTLDARVRAVLALLGVRLGHVILMDPSTGEVLAYVSTDPVKFPATRTYPAASLMKVVTAAAALRSSPEIVERDCRYVGSPYQLLADHLKPPLAGGGIASFQRALAVSNNQCFAQLAVNEVGAAALLEEMRSVGLLEEPALLHAPGRVERIHDALDLGELGAGLSGSFITPLAAARLAGLLAEGKLVRPYWIARIRGADGRALAWPDRQAPRRVWPRRLSDALRDLMVGVTEGGTASRAFHDGRGQPLLGPVRVSGKTGTLSGRDPAGSYRWFIGVAPADVPSIAIAAVVVSNGSGRAVGASEVAAAILHDLFCEGALCDPSRPVRAPAAPEGPAPQTPRGIDVAAAPPEAPARPLQILDAAPRPIGVRRLDLPGRLLRRRVQGEIVLLVDLDPEGRVVDLRVDSSDLPPEFDRYVAGEVRGWTFTPPTREGLPVRATARLPIPIRVE